MSLTSILLSKLFILRMSLLQHIKGRATAFPPVTAGKANHRLCRCCMTVKFPGCPRLMFLSWEPPNKVLRRRNMDCLAYVKLFKPSFYCVAEIMFLSQAKLSDFKNIVFLSGQKQSTSLRLPTNLNMHPNLVLI